MDRIGCTVYIGLANESSRRSSILKAAIVGWCGSRKGEHLFSHVNLLRACSSRRSGRSEANHSLLQFRFRDTLTESNMKSTFYSLATVAMAATEVAGHALFQQLWVDGKDMNQQCIRLPASNTPITNVMSNDVRCNAGGMRGMAGKCPVEAGQTVTIEMHQVR
jgi:hypothetical protein